MIDFQRQLNHTAQFRLSSGKLNAGAFQDSSRNPSLAPRHLSSSHLFPKNVGAFGLKQSWSKEFVLQQFQRLGGPVFCYHPFDRDAGVDDSRSTLSSALRGTGRGRGHRSSRPSRCKSSAGVPVLPSFKALNSAANTNHSARGASGTPPSTSTVKSALTNPETEVFCSAARMRARR